MRVYVESNFVLELAFRQEEWAQCNELLGLSGSERIRLSIPAFCLAEPLGTLERRRRRRGALRKKLEQEEQEFSRTTVYSGQAPGFAEAIGLLAQGIQDDYVGFKSARDNTLAVASILPLDAETLKSAVNWERVLEEAPDAIVFATVLGDLDRHPVEDCCFLNRNSKDFRIPEVESELSRFQCRLITSFQDGVSFIKSRLP